MQEETFEFRSFKKLISEGLRCYGGGPTPKPPPPPQPPPSRTEIAKVIQTRTPAKRIGRQSTILAGTKPSEIFPTGVKTLLGL